MEQKDENRQVILERGPSSKPHAKIIISEKRKALKDRRKINTYIADDRRSGIADRQKRNELPSKFASQLPIKEDPFYPLALLQLVHLLLGSPFANLNILYSNILLNTARNDFLPLSYNR